MGDCMAVYLTQFDISESAHRVEFVFIDHEDSAAMLSYASA